MEKILIKSGPYFAAIVSYYPNNQCAFCSWYLPDWAKDSKNPRYFADRGMSVVCPSCGRKCEKLFLGENETLEWVPDSYEMTVWRDPDILLAMPEPKMPRDCYDPEKWRQQILDYKAKRTVSSPTAIKKEKEPEIVGELKPFKGRIG